MKASRHKTTLSAISNQELPEIYHALKLDGGTKKFFQERELICWLQPFCRALISSNLESARSNLELKSHIASRISRKVADVFALSACPKAKMLLFRRYPMIVGSEIR